MKTLKDILKDILAVRSIIAIGAYGSFFFLCIIDKIPYDALIAVVSALMGHYFGTKNKKEESNANIQE